METVIRISIVYIFVMVFFRILGKRELGQLSPFDLVLLMLIPDISQQGMVGEDYSIVNAVIGLSTLLSLVFLNSVLTYRFKKAEDALDGSPTVLFCNGQFIEKAMHLERVSPDQIITSMHKSGFESLEQLKWVLLEPDGQLGFIPRREVGHQLPAKPEDSSPAAA
jgi:uncharacterized membrane protein YcaP (DUF421 family)